MDDIDYDITKPDTQPIDEEKLFRALSHVVLGYLTSERDALNDYLAAKAQGQYYPVDKHDSPSGLKRVVEKRKVFWQPLGYLPPGSRQDNSGSSGGSSGGGRGQVFRYG